MSKAFDNSQIINGAPAPIDADKVDGLQASSFARTSLSNVSNATILTKIKKVDGAGSGLDADFVKGLPADFTHSIRSNGYQKLPSGLIIQWGNFVVTGRTKAITFPIAFPNACLSVSNIWYAPGSTAAHERFLIALSRTGATFFTFGPDPTELVYWIAIGH